MYDPYYYGYFGAQRSLVTLARGALDADIEAVVATGREGVLTSVARAANLPVEVIPIPDALDVFNGGALRASAVGKVLLLGSIVRYGMRVCRYVRATGTDILYANDLRTVLFFAAAKLLMGKRLVWSIQGGPPFGRLSALAARLADDILVVSRGATKAIPAAVLPSVEHKVVVNYIGIDVDRYAPAASPAEVAEIRARYGLPPGAVVVASAGSICHRKGFDVLLEAVERTRDAGVPVHLAVAGVPEGAGSDAYMDALQRTVAEKRLPVTFVGWQESLRDLLAASDIFALASREEGLGIVTVEAMAMCVPPVVTRAGGSEETVVDGESGFVVPPEDVEALAEKLVMLARDPAERRRVGANGRVRSEQVFSVQAFIARFLRVLDPARAPAAGAEAAA
jgi:glycosyltransferase involved in cell wall biosynthesis